ncbi:hypothetical protein BKA63DRAFT_32583 [Paraphoma chrysanthemicola]|nr:hypothetical protein BKA63DRAFT_32583 [Paraphoma chrysanthemicola]
MDRIPLEIATMIVENLLIYDLAPGPNSEYTDQPSDKLVPYGERKEDMVPIWVLFTQGARLDLLNARLSCRSLYDASMKSFATILGDRPFRFTEVGTKDLRAIGQDARLTPYITTLTIGCTGFQNAANLDLGTIKHVVNNLDHGTQARLMRSYGARVKWQHEKLPIFAKIFAVLLRQFPKLETVRLDQEDLTTHLGGWLEPGDEDLLHRWGYLFRKKDEEDRSCFGYGYPFNLYKSCFGPADLLGVLSHPRLGIRDLRISGHLVPPFIQTMNFSKLRTLRLPLSRPAWFHGISLKLDIELLVDRLRKMPNLEDLSLNLQSGVRESSAGVLAALNKNQNLRRVSLTGPWNITQQALIRFLTTHTLSLRCLILEGSTLWGSWRTILNTISGLPRGTLQFFRAQCVMSIAPDGQERHENITEVDLASLSCLIEWVPHFAPPQT